MKRHYYAFETSHGGIYWVHPDGSTSEAGEMHRFVSASQRDTWVENFTPGPGIHRRAVKVSDLPHGHQVRPGRGAKYIDHRPDGEWLVEEHRSHGYWERHEFPA